MGENIVTVMEPDHEGDLVPRLRTTKHDTLSKLNQSGTLDQDHVRAGLLFAHEYERATVGSISASDPTRNPIGDVTQGDGQSWKQLDALEKVTKALNFCSPVSGRIIKMVCLENLTLAQLQEKFAGPPWRWPKRDYAGARVREAFQELVDFYAGNRV